MLREASRRLGIADTIAGPSPDTRNPLLVTHAYADMVAARIMAIACGHEDAGDLDPRATSFATSATKGRTSSFWCVVTAIAARRKSSISCAGRAVTTSSAYPRTVRGWRKLPLGPSTADGAGSLGLPK